MKYLIDHRYKLLQSISSSLQYLETLYQTGESASFKVTLDALQKCIPLIDVMHSTPFGQEENTRIQKVKDGLLHILQLPPDIKEKMQLTQTECGTLLQNLEPFVLSCEDTIDSRKLQIHECLNSLVAYHTQLSRNVKDGSPLPYMQLIANDLSAIKREDLPTDLAQGVEKALATFLALSKAPSQENAEYFDAALKEAIVHFGGTVKESDEKTGALEFLSQQFAKAQKVMSTDEASVEAVQQILRTQEVVDAVIKVTDMEFSSTEMEKIKETLFVSFQNAVLEPGDSYGSRCRMIDLYQLFGHQVHKLLELLKKGG